MEAKNLGWGYSNTPDSSVAEFILSNAEGLLQKDMLLALWIGTQKDKQNGLTINVSPFQCFRKQRHKVAGRLLCAA